MNFLKYDKADFRDRISRVSGDQVGVIFMSSVQISTFQIYRNEKIADEIAIQLKKDA